MKRGHKFWFVIKLYSKVHFFMKGEPGIEIYDLTKIFSLFRWLLWLDFQEDCCWRMGVGLVACHRCSKVTFKTLSKKFSNTFTKTCSLTQQSVPTIKTSTKLNLHSLKVVSISHSYRRGEGKVPPLKLYKFYKMVMIAGYPWRWWHWILFVKMWKQLKEFPSQLLVSLRWSILK